MIYTRSTCIVCHDNQRIDFPSQRLLIHNNNSNGPCILDLSLQMLIENSTFAAFTEKEQLLWSLSRIAKPMYPVKFMFSVEHA